MNNFYQDQKPFMILATDKAILTLLNAYQIELNNKKMMVIGESNLVGKPTKHLLKNILMMLVQEILILGLMVLKLSIF